MPVMQCPSCGYLIVNPSQPCPSCGASAAPPVAERNPPPDQYDNYHDGSSLKAIAAVIVISLACAGGFYCYKTLQEKTQVRTEKPAPRPSPSGASGGAISQAQRTAEAIKARGGGVPDL